MGKDIRAEMAQLRSMKANRTELFLSKFQATEYNSILAELTAKGLEVTRFLIVPEDWKRDLLVSRVLPGQPRQTKFSDLRLGRTAFRTRIDGVLQFLESLTDGGGVQARDTMEILSSIGERFGICVHQLGQRQRDRSPTVVEDEYDMQDLLHALLRLHFDDVRPEEWVPSYAGKNSRMDFLLPREAVAVEAKFVRDAKHSKEVGEEITVDAAKYEEHPKCEHLVAIVYDPSRHIGNPAGLKTDLQKLTIKGNHISVYICD